MLEFKTRKFILNSSNITQMGFLKNNILFESILNYSIIVKTVQRVPVYPRLSFFLLILIWYLYHNYWMNIDIIKFHNLFRCPQFYPNVLFLFQDPIQNTTLHLEVMFLRFLLTMTIQIFIVFENVDSSFRVLLSCFVECLSHGIFLMFSS